MPLATNCGLTLAINSTGHHQGAVAYNFNAIFAANINSVQHFPPLPGVCRHFLWSPGQPSEVSSEALCSPFLMTKGEAQMGSYSLPGGVGREVGWPEGGMTTPVSQAGHSWPN